MMTAEERYTRDSEFRCMVDTLMALIHEGRYTPTELREALILAATRYEMRNPRPMWFEVEPEGHLRLLGYG